MSKVQTVIQSNLQNRKFQFSVQMAQVRAARREFRNDPAKLIQISIIEDRIRKQFSDVA